jgi:hypothetical protein
MLLEEDTGILEAKSSLIRVEQDKVIVLGNKE